MPTQNQSPALSESLQRFDNLQDHYRIHFEKAWRIQILRQMSLVKEYLDGRLSLLLYVPAIGNADVPRRRLPCSSTEAANQFPSVILHLKASNGRIADNWQEKPMLIQDVEFLHSPKSIIPSVISLYPCQHKAEQIGAREVYFSILQSSFEGITRRIGGELSLVADSRRSMSLKGADPCIIKGALEIMECISDEQGDVFDSALIRQVVLDALISKLWMDIDDSGVRVFQSSDSRPQ